MKLYSNKIVSKSYCNCLHCMSLNCTLLSALITTRAHRDRIDGHDVRSEKKAGDESEVDVAHEAQRGGRPVTHTC